MKQSMSILGALLAITLAVPAQAQFAKPEDAIKYRKASLNVMAAHFGRVGAMANGRVPYDAKAAQENAEIAAVMAKLPWAAFGEGTDKGDTPAAVEQLDFEFVLFASALIDYDYIMGLIARYSQQAPGKQKMNREQLIGLIQSDAKFMNEREDIAAYIATLKAGEGLSEKAIRDGYTRFKKEKDADELAAIAQKHQLGAVVLQAFVDGILQRMIFDGEQLSELMAPLELGWKARTQAELALMKELHPILTKRAQGRDISGLSAYEQ